MISLRIFLRILPASKSRRSVIAALPIILIGAFLAKLAGEAVRGIAQGAGFGSADTLGTIVQVSILVLVFVAALQQLHVAETLVNELLIAVLVAMALAAGLAFGLGGRDLASQSLQNWYTRGQDAKPRDQRAAYAAKDHETL